MVRKNKNIEILSPGGDPDAVKAAILAGADAVYLGLHKFNARKRAVNIGYKELKELITIANDQNVRIYITLNILLTQGEIKEAINIAADLIELGVDALIVQDIGFAFLLNKLFPALEVHASTQMTTHNSYQVEFLKKFGVEQLNFSRELSKNEIEILINKCKEEGIKTEIFVHGAYCISCSGICYMSAAISAQPGNRGACLQPCRKKYSTENDEDKDYLLSLKDNNALDNAEELVRAGADSLKIEGRIKNFHYVYSVTDAWRRRIDSIIQDNNSDSKNLQKQVGGVFNRGFSTGYFNEDISGNMLVDSPLDQSLQKVGMVKQYNANKKELIFNEDVKVFTGDNLNIYTIDNNFICTLNIKKKINNCTYLIEIENVLKGKIQNGNIALRMRNADDIQKIKSQIDNLKVIKQKLNMRVSGKLGQQLEVEFVTNGKSTSVQSQSVLQLSQKNELNIEILSKQLGRLGDTDFELAELDISGLQKALFLPIKELNEIRREGVKYFQKQKPEFVFPEIKKATNNLKEIGVLISDTGEIETIKNNFSGKIFIEASSVTGKDDLADGVNPWFPSFITNQEFEFYKELILASKPELSICDNSGLGFWMGENNFNWVAGPQLNSTNGYSFEAYKNFASASGAFFSSEINKDQINEIVVPENFDTYFTVSGPVLLMTTRQCLFLKPGLCPVNKTKTDKSCLKGCYNYSQYSDERDVPFHILKSKGYQNRIYNDAILFLPEALSQLNANNFIVDLRSLPFMQISVNKKIKILDYFTGLINKKYKSENNDFAVKKIFGKVTRGNYLRGFETN